MNCLYCDREIFSKDMCKRHYQQMRKYGYILSKDEERERLNKNTKCSEENCNNRIFAKGLCQKHYMRGYRIKEMKSKKIVPIRNVKYVLIDLERSFNAGGRIYWKSNKQGYTANPAHAGIYSAKQAIETSLNDMDGLTVLLPLDEEFNRLIRDTTKIYTYED